MNEISDKKGVIEAILESLRNGAYIVNACNAAGIARGTLHKWRKENEILDKIIEEAKRGRIEIVEDALFKQAISGNITAQIFFLKNRAADKWKDRLPEETPTQIINIVNNHATDNRNLIDALRHKK